LMEDCYPFEYNRNFLYQDLNLNSRAVSQDSYPFTVPDGFELRAAAEEDGQ